MKESIRHFVTGGAGFIGSHLVSRLLSEGKHVTAYDNLSSGRKEWISEHLENPHFKFIQEDLLDHEALVRSMDGHDFVWHLGANADIPSGYRDTELHLKHCIVATRNVLEAMRKNGAAVGFRFQFGRLR